VTLEAVTDEAQAWVKEHVHSDEATVYWALTSCASALVEAICDGLRSDGLLIELH